MASFHVDDYLDLSTQHYHDASSWQVAKDANFEQIIDQTIKDTINVKSWHTPLIDPITGEYLRYLDKLYVRVKVHMGDDESDWFNLPVETQLHQTYVVTEEGQDDRTIYE